MLFVVTFIVAFTFARLSRGAFLIFFLFFGSLVLIGMCVGFVGLIFGFFLFKLFVFVSGF